MREGACQLDIVDRPGWEVNKFMKQFPSQQVAHNPSYIWRCLIFVQCMGEYRRENTKHFFANSWVRGHVNLIFYKDLAGDMN